MTTRISDAILREVLERASAEEMLALTQVVKCDAATPLKPDALQDVLGRLAGHSVFNALRGKGVSYAEILADAAETLEVRDAPRLFAPTKLGYSVSALENMRSTRVVGVADSQRVAAVENFVDQLERKLISRLLAVTYERATPEQRRRIDTEVQAFLRTNEDKGLKGLSTGAALLAIGNLGGFATYTLASTVLSALSFGTLGFGAYTFASSALSVLLGPVGWLALGLAAVVKLGGPRKGSVVRIACTAALTSQRLREERRRAEHK